MQHELLWTSRRIVSGGLRVRALMLARAVPRRSQPQSSPRSKVPAFGRDFCDTSQDRGGMQRYFSPLHVSDGFLDSRCGDLIEALPVGRGISGDRFI
jgi:hypothetical protein